MTSYTKQQLADKLPVMAAWTQGKQVQFKRTTEPDKGKWIDTPTPSWDNDLEYRIKPEVVKVERWAVVNTRTGIIWYESKKEASAIYAASVVDRDADHHKVVKLEGTYER